MLFYNNKQIQYLVIRHENTKKRLTRFHQQVWEASIGANKFLRGSVKNELRVTVNGPWNQSNLLVGEDIVVGIKEGRN